jgi:hypothetical protein
MRAGSCGSNAPFLQRRLCCVWVVFADLPNHASWRSDIRHSRPKSSRPHPGQESK